MTGQTLWSSGIQDWVEIPHDFRVVVTHSESTFRSPFVRFGLWLLRQFGKELHPWGTHALLLFYFAGRDPVVVEAMVRGVVFGQWDEAHKQDGYRMYRDLRAGQLQARDAWFYCKGRRGVLYEFPLLVRVILRVFFEAWLRVKQAFVWVLSVTRGHGGISQVCTTLVNGMSAEVFGAPYVNRSDPTPDEIAASEFLELVEEQSDASAGRWG